MYGAKEMEMQKVQGQSQKSCFAMTCCSSGDDATSTTAHGLAVREVVLEKYGRAVKP
jgi:hypothetical protein